MFIPRRLRRVQVKPGTLPEIVTVSICDMTASRTGVRRNNNNVVLSRVTLHPRFSNEILLVAGQARKPVQHRQFFIRGFWWEIDADIHFTFQ